MKINEVLQRSDRALFEALDKSNDTPFSTEDLMSIHRQHTSGKWEEASYDELMEELDALIELDSHE